MKFQLLISIAALVATCLFSACQNDSGSSTESTADTASGTQSTTELPLTTPATAADIQPIPGAVTPGTISPLPTEIPATPTKQEPPQNAAGVWHYTCPKGCKGGAGAANPCAKCGATLAHNTAYHPTPAPATTTTTTTPPGISSQPATQTATPAKQEPPQNAAGVWHYICPGGCAGGGGSALACPKCSKMLVHNTAYHQ